MKMPKNLRIEVTKGDITMGMGGGVARCPIALAVRRTTNASWVAVDGAHASLITSDGATSRYSMTERAGHFVQAFDAGRPVNPFVTVLRRL